MNLTPESKVLIQGITQSRSSAQAALMMKASGTQIVAGVSPGQGGQNLEDIPIFDLVEQALAVTGPIDTTIIFVSPYAVLDAALEAMAAGIRQIIILTAGVPPLDMVRLVRKAEATETLVVGPNCPGIIIPHQLLLGIHPQEFYTPGPIGIISRSSTLTYQVAWELTQVGLGQSISVSIGSDLIIGSSYQQWLQFLDEDEHTELIVLVGETGGGSEEAAASYIAETIDKPVIAYIAGRHAPKGQPLGHAGMLISSRATAQTSPMVKMGNVDSKITAFKNAKIPVAERPSQIPELVKKHLKRA